MDLIPIYEGTQFECYMIMNLLENEGIESVLNNEVTGTRGGNMFRPAGGVKVIVAGENYEKARAVVEEYEKSRKG
ncbi:MAG: DUF2007 domain-containing protein [Bacteroidales bacterium]|jgi:predicted Fe-Mo cluster-binding NifX family protein|nr:DUF2007 domain-containing protein [Bacteroidales bacterium]